MANDPKSLLRQAALLLRAQRKPKTPMPKMPAMAPRDVTAAKPRGGMPMDAKNMLNSDVRMAATGMPRADDLTDSFGGYEVDNPVYDDAYPEAPNMYLTPKRRRLPKVR